MQYQANEQLQLASDYVQFTNENIFLTGKAGTGKTTFLKHLKTHLPKRMIVVAPTGVAAINAGGVTLHSFFQLAFAPYIPQLYAPQQLSAAKPDGKSNDFAKKFNKDKINIIRSLDLLVIDEISMVRADVLDAVDDVLRRYKNRFKPFGGVQLLMIGDVQQLAPVIKDDEWQMLRPYYNSVFFFSSKALQQTNYVSIELKHIFRQSDAYFIALLNKVRDNIIDKPTLDALNARYIKGFDPPQSDGYINLTTHNAQANAINETKLNKLTTKAYTYAATIESDFPEYAYPTDAQLVLKDGAQVMFVKNDSSPEKRYFNGKIGTITELTSDTIVVKCASDDEPITVNPETWENVKYTIDNNTKDIHKSIVGTFTQYPLKLAWAITIHKSQGLTFEKAVIDANAAFAHGQVYVALSRCKTLDGLVLSSPIEPRSIKSDTVVLDFSRTVDQNQPTAKELSESKRKFEHELVFELFDFKPMARRMAHVVKTITENAASIQATTVALVKTCQQNFLSQLLSVADTFQLQLQQLLLINVSVDENAALQERLIKACLYFDGKVQEILVEGIKMLDTDTDNKVVRKDMKEDLEKLNHDIALKHMLLKACSNGFEVKHYLETRAKGAIAVAEKAHTHVGSNANAHTESDESLFARLRKWRNARAAEDNVPAYVVFHQTTLVQIASTKPQSIKALAEIKGFGKKRAQKYGGEILEIIEQAGIEIDTPNDEKNESQAEHHVNIPKEAKPNTKLLTYSMFISGKSIEEIARERSMAVSTIEGHVAHFVGTGEIHIHDVLPHETIKLISAYFLQSDTKALNQAKQALGEGVSYAALKLVLKHIEYEQFTNSEDL